MRKFESGYAALHFPITAFYSHREIAFTNNFLHGGHPRIMKIHKNLSRDTPNDFPKFRGDWMYVCTDKHTFNFIYMYR